MPTVTNSQRWSGLVMTILATALAACAGTPTPGVNTPGLPATGPTPGATAATAAVDCSFVDVQGKKRQLSEFKGTFVLLIEWAYWCPHCQAELPKVQKDIQQVYGDRGISVVNIEASGGLLSDVTSFAQKFGITMPLYRDDGTSTVKAYPTVGFPTIRYIAPDFTVRGMQSGEVATDVMIKAFEPFVK